MKKKHTQVLGKVNSFYEAELHVSDRQLLKKEETLKNRMVAAQLKLMTEKETWHRQLQSLDNDLATAKDQVFIEKAKRREAVRQQLDKAQRAVSIVRNYSESLEETNNDLRDELKQALLAKREQSYV